LSHAAQRVSALIQQMGEFREQIAKGHAADSVPMKIVQYQDAMLDVEQTLLNAQIAQAEQLRKAAESIENQAAELKALKDRLVALEGRGGAPAPAAAAPATNEVASGGAAVDPLAALPLPPLPELPGMSAKRPLEDPSSGADPKSQKLLGAPAVDLLGSGTKVVSAKVTQLRAPGVLPLAGLTIEEVFQAFSTAGQIAKIVCFAAPMTGPPFEHVDAMVQYKTIEGAKAAVKVCNGHSLAQDGHFRVEVTPSMQSELIVPMDGPQSRDYTRADGGAAAPPPAPALAPPAPVAAPALAAPAEAAPAASPRVITVHIRDLHLPNVAPLGGLTADMVGTAFKQFGGVEKIVMGPDHSPLPLVQLDAFVQYSTTEAARRAISSAQGQSLTGDGYHNMQVEVSSLTELMVMGNSNWSWDYTPGMAPNTAAARMP